MRLRELTSTLYVVVLEHILILACLLLAFVGYAVLAFHAPPSDSHWLFDILGGVQQLSIDDAYRYFAARAAWHDVSLWSWVYVLPGDLFYNGVLSRVFDGYIFPMRLAHVLVCFVGVFFIYLSCLHLGVRKWLATLVSVAWLLMPLFVAVSMSFYGESLLTALFSLAIYCHLSGRRYAFCLFASWMTLVQPEGLFIMLPFFIGYAWKRDWKMLCLMALPGFIYFLYVLHVHHGLWDYLKLHLTITRLYPALPTEMNARSSLAFLVTLNPFFIVLSVVGLALGRVGRLLLAGITLWMVFLVLKVQPLQGYEPRFLVPCLPALFLGYGYALERLIANAERWQLAPVGTGGVVLVLLLLLLDCLGQLDPVRYQFLGAKRWPWGQPAIGVKHFVRLQSRNVEDGQELAQRVTNFLARHEDVGLLAVSNYALFYYLNPQSLPKTVQVCYSPFTAESVYTAFGGRYFCMSSRPPEVAFYHFYPSSIDKRKAVFVGDFSAFGWKPAYENSLGKAYEVGYETVSPPEKLYVIQRQGKNIPVFKPSDDLCKQRRDIVCPNWSNKTLF